MWNRKREEIEFLRKENERLRGNVRHYQESRVLMIEEIEDLEKDRKKVAGECDRLREKVASLVREKYELALLLNAKTNSNKCKHYDEGTGVCKYYSGWNESDPSLEYCVEGPCMNYREKEANK